jgi:hypothetical protein
LYIEDCIPKEIIEKLKDSKQYLDKHSKELNGLIKEKEKN